MVHIQATPTHLPTTAGLGNFQFKIFLQANFCIIQLSLLKLQNNNHCSTVIVHRILLHVSFVRLHVFNENRKYLKCGIYIMGLRQLAQRYRDGPKTKWQLQSMYRCLHSNIITGEQMLASKVHTAVYIPHPSLQQHNSNYFKVANPKQSKVRIVLLFFFSQPILP